MPILRFSPVCLIFPLHCSPSVFHLFHGPVDGSECYYGGTLLSPPLPPCHRCLAPIHHGGGGLVGSQAAHRPTIAAPLRCLPPGGGPGAAAEAPAGAPPKVGHYQMTDSFISGVESVGEHWRGHLADDPGEVGKSAGTSQVGGDGWCCSERDCQSQLLGSGINSCVFGILIKLHHTGCIFLRLKKKAQFHELLFCSGLTCRE